MKNTRIRKDGGDGAKETRKENRKKKKKKRRREKGNQALDRLDIKMKIVWFPKDSSTNTATLVS